MGVEIAGVGRGGGRIAEDRIHRWFVFSLFCLGRGYNYSTTLLYSNLLSSIPHSPRILCSLRLAFLTFRKFFGMVLGP